MSECYWKVLSADRTAYHGGKGQWPEPGTWLEVDGPLVPCEHGLHVCRREDLIRWLGPTIWEVEVEGEQVVAQDKIVVRRARLVRQLETWNDRTARLFACDCAEAVLPIYEKTSKSTAPREAIAVARRFANGKATSEELAAAGAAARAAARDAAGDAAWAAARAAARDAAGDAAGAAAWDAAWAAAGDAAWAAAGDAQTDMLFRCLYPDGEPT